MDFIRRHLCCCLVPSQDHDREDSQNRGRFADHEIPNETALLIPQEEGDGSGFVGYGSYQDQERLERRLGGIVRSKESKMVRIGYTHPFNLHNKDLIGSSETTHTISRSNSNSGSSFVHHPNAYAGSSSEHVPVQYAAYGPHYGGGSGGGNSQGQGHGHGHGQHQTHHYEPSPLSHSRSASRDPEDDSRPNVPYADQQEMYYDDAGSVIADQPRPTPILNVRLVKRDEGKGGKDGKGDRGDRGRRRERAVSAGSEVEGGGGVRQKVGEGEEGELKTPTAERPVGRVGGQGEVRAVEAKKKRTFVLDDVDSIAVSWGD